LNKRRNLKKVSDENELVPPETQKSVRHALRSSTNLKRKTQSAQPGSELPYKVTRREPPALRRFQESNSEDEDEENKFLDVQSISVARRRKTNMQGVQREIRNLDCCSTRSSTRDITGLYRLRSDGASSGTHAGDSSDSDSSELTAPDTDWSDDSDEDVSSSLDTAFFSRSSDVDEDVDRFAPATSRFHRCTTRCPYGCRGNYRPSEIIIYEGVSTRLMLGSRKVSPENPVTVELNFSAHRRVGGRGVKRPSRASNVPVRRTEEQAKCCQYPLPQRIAHLLDSQEVGVEEALLHAWNPQDRSFNIRVKDEDPFTIRRQPVAQSTDSARTLQGYSTGLHIFEIMWPVHQRGTHAAIGVSTDRQTLHSIGYSTLIGQSDQSWGWDLGRLKAYHNSNSEPGWPYPSVIHADFKLGDTIFLVLDCDAGRLSFVSEGRWLGVAHSGLQARILHPTVSGVWGNCEVTMRYHGGISNGSVISLSELCRTEIRAACSDFSALPIPRPLKNYLQSN